MAKNDLLKKVNKAISASAVSNRDGVVVGAGLDEALVTDDGKLLYPIIDGIPVLLEGESIALEQLEA